MAINVQAYGATGNGTTDDTTAIANALAAATAAGGGCVYFPAGVYLTGPQTLASKVDLVGDGRNSTTLLLRPGANADLLSGNANLVNLAASWGTNSTGGTNHWSIRHLTLDANGANQSGPSYGIRIYGYAWQLEDVVIRNAYADGLLADWNGGDLSTGEEVECQLSGVEVHHCGGVGIRFGGPHDSQFANILAFANGSHNVHLAPNAGGTTWTGFHGWGTAWGVNAACILCEASNTQFYNFVAEASDVAQVVSLANDCIFDGFLYINGSGLGAVGLQLGQQAGLTPYPGSIYQSGGSTIAITATNHRCILKISNCTGGGINFANERSNVIQALIYQTTAGYLGTPNVTDVIQALVIGPTTDGTPSLGGQFSVVADSSRAFSVNDGYTGTDVFVIDSHAGQRSTRVANGAFALAPSSSAQALSSNATITTSQLGMIRVTSLASLTGLVLQPGTVNSQVIAVVNESSHTLTFASSSSSHVSNGSSVSIGAGAKQVFMWDSATGLWY